MLLDCGNGVFAKLRRFVDYVDVDAVVISHLHADHFLDLVPFASALHYAPRQQPVPVGGYPGTDRPARPRLHRRRPAPSRCSAGVRRRRDDRATTSRSRSTLHDLRPGATRSTLGAADACASSPSRTSSRPTPSSSRERRRAAAPTAPTARPTTRCATFAAGTDLLLIEATLPRPERDGPRGHLTPGEAGEHGRAGAARGGWC